MPSSLVSTLWNEDAKFHGILDQLAIRASVCLMRYYTSSFFYVKLHFGSISGKGGGRVTPLWQTWFKWIVCTVPHWCFFFHAPPFTSIFFFFLKRILPHMSAYGYTSSSWCAGCFMGRTWWCATRWLWNMIGYVTYERRLMHGPQTVIPYNIMPPD